MITNWELQRRFTAIIPQFAKITRENDEQSKVRKWGAELFSSACTPCFHESERDETFLPGLRLYYTFSDNMRKLSPSSQIQLNVRPSPVPSWSHDHTPGLVGSWKFYFAPCCIYCISISYYFLLFFVRASEVFLDLSVSSIELPPKTGNENRYKKSGLKQDKYFVSS